MKITSAFAALLLAATQLAAQDAANLPRPEAASAQSLAPNLRSENRRSDIIPPLRPTAKLPALPPRPALPDGVTDITFDDFFKMPIGPLGMEFTDKIKALSGKRVRLAGYQVAEMVGVCNSEPNANSPARRARAMLEASVPGRLILSPVPESVNFGHYGLCEDLAPQVVFITVPALFGQAVPQHPGPLLVTGILDLGNKPEPDGRVSALRLTLDPEPAPKSSPLSAQPATAAPPHQTKTASTTTK